MPKFFWRTEGLNSRPLEMWKRVGRRVSTSHPLYGPPVGDVGAYRWCCPLNRTLTVPPEHTHPSELPSNGWTYSPMVCARSCSFQPLPESPKSPNLPKLPKSPKIVQAAPKCSTQNILAAFFRKRGSRCTFNDRSENQKRSSSVPEISLPVF